MLDDIGTKRVVIRGVYLDNERFAVDVYMDDEAQAKRTTHPHADQQFLYLVEKVSRGVVIVLGVAESLIDFVDNQGLPDSFRVTFVSLE